MTMREKMAYAIALKNGREERYEEFLPEADAALDALLEPTEVMIDAGLDNGSGDQLVEGPDTTFARMIKAAKDGK